MKCRYCAEEIKADAIVCRFCGAMKEAGEWKPPQPHSGAAAPAARPGRSTILIAGVFFVISAVFELASVTSDVPLFGEVRGGAVAILYHGVYAALFLAMGTGLLAGRRWGYWIVLAGTLFYTLERALYVLDRKTMEAYLTRQLQRYADILELIDKDTLLQITIFSTVLFVVCWWGFALYVHLRRGYFRP